MKNHSRLIFGAVCLCLFTQIGFAEEVPQLGEKGSKSKSKVNVCIPSQPPCPPIPGPEGPEGPQGATGACSCPCCDPCSPCPTGPIGPTGGTGAPGPQGSTEPCFQTYATVFVIGSPPLNSIDYPSISLFSIPFNTQGTSSSNISLNATNHRVEIPVGIYKVWFQTMLVGASFSNIDFESFFLRVYGTGAPQDLLIDWTHSQAPYSDDYFSPYSGETILQIADPGSGGAKVNVELFFQRSALNGPTDGIYLNDPFSSFNSPARMVLIKLADLPTQV